MASLVLTIYIILFIFGVNCDDSSIFFYNDFTNCKSNEIFNVDYLKCQICDNNLFLVPQNNSK